MKICPKCSQTYNDDSLNYCLNDGEVLVSASDHKTAEQFRRDPVTSNNPTARYTNYAPAPSQATLVKDNVSKKSNPIMWVLLILGGLVLVCGGGFAGIYAVYVAQKNYNANVSANDLLANKKSDRDSNRNAVVPTRQNPSDTDSNNGLTIEKFKQLEPKMSYKKTVEILGGEGTQMSSSGSGDYKAEMYKWGGDTEFVVAMFLNDKLTTKTQAGLSKNVIESLSLEKYNRLKNGMKYEEAAAILGEGEEQSVTEILGSKTTSYQWKGENYSSITAGFSNDKLNSKSQFGLK